jgi:hypothetical protein
MLDLMAVPRSGMANSSVYPVFKAYFTAAKEYILANQPTPKELRTWAVSYFTYEASMS